MHLTSVQLQDDTHQLLKAYSRKRLRSYKDVVDSALRQFFRRKKFQLEAMETETAR